MRWKIMSGLYFFFMRKKTPTRVDPWEIWDLRLAYWFLDIWDKIAFPCFLFSRSFSISLPFLFLLSVFWFSCIGFFPFEITAFPTRILFYQVYKEINIRTNPSKKQLCFKNFKYLLNIRNSFGNESEKKITFRQKLKTPKLRKFL